MLTASQRSFQSLITYHQKRRFRVLPFFPCPRPEWRKRKRQGGKREKKERSWVMDALCLSVIPNYWTLPFKASLHFSFLPFWLMKSRLWLGALCFKHCLAGLSAFTSVTICCIARTCSTINSFLICYSCSVIICIVSPFFGMLKNKWHILITLTCNLKKYTSGSVWSWTLIRSRCTKHLLLVLPRLNLFNLFTAYQQYVYWFQTHLMLLQHMKSLKSYGF